MKMGKFLAVKIIMALVLGSMVFCLIWTNLYGEYPLKMGENFKKVFYSTSDEKNIYRIDQSQKRITKTSIDKNEIEKVINLGNGNSTFSAMAVGDDNKIYAVKVTKLSSSQTKEEIVQYTNNGENIILDSEELKLNGKLSYLSVKGDCLSFITVSDKENPNIQNVLYYETSISKKTTELKRGIKIPDNKINKIIGFDPNTIYFTGMNGYINIAEPNPLGFKRIYPLGRNEDNKSNPVFIDVFRKGFVFADERKMEISLLENNKVKVLLSNTEFKDLLNKRKMEYKPLITQSVKTLNENTVFCTVSDYSVSIKVDSSGNFIESETKIYRNEAVYKKLRIAKTILIWAVFIILFGLLLKLLSIIYKRYVRTKIKRKQYLIFIIILGLAFIFVMFIIKLQFELVLTDRIHKQLSSKAGYVVEHLNLKDFMDIKSTSDYDKAVYKNTRGFISDIQNSSLKEESQVYKKDFFSDFTGWIMLKLGMKDEYYSILYKIEEDKNNDKNIEYIFNICVTDNDENSPYHPYFIPENEDRQVYNNAVKNSQFLEKQIDETGEYMVLLAPIFDKQDSNKQNSNKVLGVFEIGIDRAAMTEYVNDFLIKIALLIFLVLLLCVTLVTAAISRFILKPLTELQQGVLKTDGKTWSSDLNINTGDELEDISNSFNSMNKRLKDRINKIEEIQRAYARFFPNQIKDFLDKNSIECIQRKDYKSNEMGVMMTNICSYYSFSKNMTDDQRFDFIDTYINKVGPIIYKDGGFISKLTGDGIMALFPINRSVDKLINSALKIQKGIREYNIMREKSGDETFQIGLGLHLSKSLLLGIVGFESKTEDVNRLEVAVLDEEVVLTEAIQNAAQGLGASILVTERIINGLEFPSKYQYRYLGLAQFQNIQQRTEIYDVYQEDDEELRNAKEKTRKKFEEGVLLYQKQQFNKAKNIFIDIIGINDRDLAAKMYYFLCDEYEKAENLPENWDKQINL